jgi:hypothetical protein
VVEREGEKAGQGGMTVRRVIQGAVCAAVLARCLATGPILNSHKLTCQQDCCALQLRGESGNTRHPLVVGQMYVLCCVVMLYVLQALRTLPNTQ